MRMFLKYDIGKNARNDKYAEFGKLVSTNTGPTNTLNKRGAQYWDVATNLVFD